MPHLFLRSTKCASTAGGTFPRLILGIGIRARIPVKPAHEFPPPPFLLLRGFGRIYFLQNQRQLAAAQFPSPSCFPHRRFGFGVQYSHRCQSKHLLAIVKAATFQSLRSGRIPTLPPSPSLFV